MKTRAKARMKSRRDRFVVGYIRAKNIAFGAPGSAFNSHYNYVGPEHNSGVDPLTRKQAEKILASMPCADCAIFELVPVEVNR